MLMHASEVDRISSHDPLIFIHAIEILHQALFFFPKVSNHLNTIIRSAKSILPVVARASSGQSTFSLIGQHRILLPALHKFDSRCLIQTRAEIHQRRLITKRLLATP